MSNMFDRLKEAFLGAAPKSEPQEVKPIAEPLTEAKEPPLADGMSRLYHPGGREAIEDSAWFTSSRTYAEQFASQRADGVLHYVDLPTDHPLIEPEWPDQSIARGFTQSLELPEELARQAKPLGSVTIVPSVPTEAIDPQEIGHRLAEQARSDRSEYDRQLDELARRYQPEIDNELEM